jgi:hypothetical protein
MGNPPAVKSPVMKSMHVAPRALEAAVKNRPRRHHIHPAAVAVNVTYASRKASDQHGRHQSRGALHAAPLRAEVCK